MGTKTCRVTIRDMAGIDHTAHVSADSLYEAVARGLVAIQKSSWSEELTTGKVTVTALEPQIEHSIEMSKFNSWLKRPSRSPKDVVAHQKVEAILRGRP
jgi:hypothetical protein